MEIVFFSRFLRNDLLCIENVNGKICHKVMKNDLSNSHPFRDALILIRKFMNEGSFFYTLYSHLGIPFSGQDTFFSNKTHLVYYLKMQTNQFEGHKIVFDDNSLK